MMAWLRRTLLTILLPITTTLGKLSASVSSTSHPLPPEKQRLLELLQDGDALVTRTDWRPTNVLIPGYWAHVGMYRQGEVIEAVYPKVRSVSAIDFLSRVDHVTVRRVTGPSREQRHEISNEMKRYVGIPYDFMFEPGHKAFYCSEAVYEAIRVVLKNWKFEPRDRMGVMTITPQDIADARAYFREVVTK